MATVAAVGAVVRAALADPGHDLEVVDVEVGPTLVRVTLDRPGGVDLDTLTLANRIVSEALDRHDPLSGRYTLEVSSPGLERPLRTPEHFRRFVGATVAVKTKPGTGGERRAQGRLSFADDDGIVVEVDGAVPAHQGSSPAPGRRIAYIDIERARTVFEWGAPPSPQRQPGPAGGPQRQPGPAGGPQRRRRSGQPKARERPTDPGGTDRHFAPSSHPSKKAPTP